MKFTFNEIKTIYELSLENYEYLENYKNNDPDTWNENYNNSNRKKHSILHDILKKIEGESY